MSNYDFELDMTSRNSLSLIISRIAENSTVLEFGPANGRMTKYLKEILGCTVYAVELDEESAKSASEFCEDILVGDIEKFKWLRKYQDIEFDYIIFADVLEHLYNPEIVLTKAKILLKNEGSILMSLPNIAHNAIIIDLLNDKFTYRKTGLLDNTHIRFFTKHTLEELVTNSGLEIAFEGASYVEPSNTEFKNNYTDLDRSVALLLSGREFGEAYQFIFEAKHKAPSLQTDFLQEDAASLYIDTGKGFNESAKVTTIFDSHKENVINFTLDTKIPNVKAIRIDPLEMPLSLKIEKIIINGADEINKPKHNGVGIGDNELNFLDNDPQLLIDFDEPVILENVAVEYKYLTKNHTVKDEKIELQAETINSQAQQIEALKSDVSGQEQTVNRQAQQIEALKSDVSGQEQTVNRQAQQIEALKSDVSGQEQTVNRQAQQIEALKSDVSGQEQTVNRQAQQIEALKSDVSGQEQTVNSQAQQIEALKGDVSAHMTNIRELHEQLRVKTEHINNLEQHAVNLIAIIESLRLKNRLKRIVPRPVKSTLKKIYFKINRGNVIRRKLFQSIHMNGLFFSLKQLYFSRAYKGKAVEFKNTIITSGNIENKHENISIVIPTYNGLHDLSKLIPQLIQQIGFDSIEIIIIDSSSNDGTKDFFDNFKEIIFVSIEQKDFSHSSARNLGFTHATSETVLFMVQDAMPTSEKWLYQFVDIFNQNNVVALSCTQIPNAEADLYTCYGLDQFNNFLDISSPVTKVTKKYISSPEYARKLAQLDNVACLVKSKVFEKYLFRGEYAEDLDFGLRLIKDKYQIGMTSEVSVIHSHLRSPYYYMKRAMVETEVVNEMFDKCRESIDLDDQLADISATLFLIAFFFVEMKKIKLPIDLRELRSATSNILDSLLAREYVKEEYPFVNEVLCEYDVELMNSIDVLFKNNIELKKGGLFFAIHHVNNQAMSLIQDRYTIIDKKILSEYILFILNTYGVWSGVRFGSYKKEYLEKFPFLQMLFQELRKGV